VPEGDLTRLAEGYSSLETPRRHDGRLWAVDMLGGQIVAFTADRSVDVTVAVPDAPVGLGWARDGHLLVLTRGGRLLRRDADLPVQVTDPIIAGPGTVQRDDDRPGLQTDGSLTHRRVWAAFGSPATATTLPGVLAHVRVWPDGIALDAEGAVWVADAFGRQAARVVEGGEITDRISTGDLGCYACALGGPNGDTLFLCVAPPGLNGAACRTARSTRTCRVGVPAAEDSP
jgi:sugar lactone lactonase YvrE